MNFLEAPRDERSQIAKNRTKTETRGVPKKGHHHVPKKGQVKMGLNNDILDQKIEVNGINGWYIEVTSWGGLDLERIKAFAESYEECTPAGMADKIADYVRTAKEVRGIVHITVTKSYDSWCEETALIDVVM